MTSEPFKFAVSKDCDVFEFKDRNIIFETTQAKLREEKAEPARGMAAAQVPNACENFRTCGITNL